MQSLQKESVTSIPILFERRGWGGLDSHNINVSNHHTFPLDAYHPYLCHRRYAPQLLKHITRNCLPGGGELSTTSVL